MGFLDFLNEIVSGGKDELARALRTACSNSGMLPAFYKKFMESDVYALVYKSDMKEGEHVLNEHSSVKLIRMNDKKFPVFSSREKIFDNGLVRKDGISFICMKGTEFLKITKGDALILNPFSKFSKELLPTEIEGMLSGKIFVIEPEPIIIKDRSDFIIGLPAERPKKLIESVRSYCAAKPEIDAVYLALFSRPQSNEKPHYLIAVSSPAPSLHEIFSDLKQIITAHLAKNEILEMTPLKGSSFEDYLSETDPIYRK